MKFVGLSKGEFKIFEEFDPAQLSSLKADFFWLDADSLDPRTLVAIKKCCGVEGLEESVSGVSRRGKYDLLTIEYYAPAWTQVRVAVSEGFIITAHSGLDAVCEEAMASVNEMIVGGGLDSGSVLTYLLASALDKDAAYLKSFQMSVKGMDGSLKSGVRDLRRLANANDDARAVRRVLSSARSQAADIVIGTSPVMGVKPTEALVDVYNRANELSRGADDIYTIVSGYMNSMVIAAWSQAGKSQSLALGLFSLSISVGGAALFYMLFPDGLYGFDRLAIMAGIVGLGAIGLIAAQRKPKFRIRR